MALQEITTVQISLLTSAVSRAGFGTPMFMGSHHFFPERVRSYNSIDAAAADIPTTSNEYAALTGFFSQIPAPNLVKIGRVDSTATLSIDGDAVNAVTYEATVISSGTTVNASYTATVPTDTAQTVFDDFATQLASLSAGVTVNVVGVGNAAVLTLVAVDAETSFTITLIDELVLTEAETESGSTAFNAIRAVDSDFYFITYDNHAQADVLALATTVEATESSDRPVLYFTSTSDTSTLDAVAVPNTDVLGLLADFERFRTTGMYHHQADTIFPECAFVAVAAPADPGTKVWGVNRIAGVPVALDGNSLELSFTQRDNLNNRNANWTADLGGITIVRTGKVAANEWIDAMRNKDFMVARLTENLQNKQINSPVIPYTNSGINEVRNVATTTLDRMVSTEISPNILQEFNPYTTDFPRAEDVSFSDKVNRTLNASFTAYLAGAIQITKITGTLTFENV